MTKVVNAQNKVIKEVFTHLQFMGYMTMRDRYGFGKVRLCRFWDNIASLFEQYTDGKISVEEMIAYCDIKSIDYKGMVEAIPSSQRIKLSKYKGVQGCKPVQMMKFVNAPYVAYYLIASIVLKETFEFSSEKINQFGNHMAYYVDSYVRNYLNDKMIGEIILEECGLDLFNGGSNG